MAPRFILDQHRRGVWSGEMSAATLFADISGFSAMMDTLMAHGQHGAEVGANIMRAAFDPMIEAVFQHGGFVAGQAGDAFTAIFPVSGNGNDLDATRNALAAAVRIQAACQERPTHDSPYGSFAIGVKIGLAFGEVQWGIVRSSDDQRAVYYFRGDAIDACAEAEHHARAGDIMLSQEAGRLLAETVTIEANGAIGRVVGIHTALPAGHPATPGTPDLATLSRYFPVAVLTQEYSGEFRWVISVFVAMHTVRTDTQLHAFVQTVFELQQRFGGFISRVDFGDKGANLLVFWGAPVTHENDIQRSLEFLLDLQAGASIPVSAGATYRIAHAGAIGGALAEEYTCYGRGVNLAARLMTASSPGEILVDEEIARRAEQRFDLEFIGERSFKGFAANQRVYQLLGRKEGHDDLFRWPLVGRIQELRQLEAFLQPLSEGRSAGAAIILGEAGIGKSHLANAVRHAPGVEALHAAWALCQTNQTLRAGFGPFRQWLMDYFGQSPTQIDARNKLAFNRRMNLLVAEAGDAALGRELDRTRSFIGALIGLHWPDSLYEEMDPEGRFENTVEGLITLLLVESLRQPLIFLLEDAQWLDADSLALLERLWRRIDSRPVALLATVRSEQLAGDMRDRLDRLIAGQPSVQIELARLNEDELACLAADILGAPAAPSLLALLRRQTEGNPLFAQQYVLHLREQGQLAPDETGALDVPSLDLAAAPPDIQALIIARMDTLTQEIRNVVHTAAVLGREFEVRLLSQMLRNGRPLEAVVASAEQAAIWQPLNELRHIFLHTLVRDTAYSMLTHERRRRLHLLAAESLEMVYAVDVTPAAPAIGFHYEQAERAEPARRYLTLAGEEAARSYQNQAAVDFFTRALALNPTPQERCDLLLAREAVLNWQGDRQRQAEDLQALAALAEQIADPRLHAELSLRQANYRRATGDIPAALAHAQAAISSARLAGDASAEAKGHALSGRILLHRGQYEEAIQWLEQARNLAGQAGDTRTEAQSTYDTGVARYYQDDFEPAERYVASARALYARISDLKGEVSAGYMMATINKQLGRYQRTLDQFDESLAAAQRGGWRQGEVQILATLGNTYLRLGGYAEAQRCHQQALAACRAMNDREGEAASLDVLGLVAADLGDLDGALQRYDQALAIQRAIGYRRGEGYTLTHTGHALLRLGHPTQAAQVFQEALTIRRELSPGSGAAIDDLAGLALAALAQGESAEAGRLAGECLAWIEAHGLGGMESAAQVYLACFQALQASDPTRAAQALDQGYQHLAQLAAAIADPQLSRAVLENVPIHRELITAWQRVVGR
jgi:class 3 adenylate cyclase/tetratricopeptide (TPR) repeat protein